MNKRGERGGGGGGIRGGRGEEYVREGEGVANLTSMTLMGVVNKRGERGGGV